MKTFPVGRRLAFDPAKGRLWVVCQFCARWNLTPLEERWEAVEQSERLFRETRLRVATDNVGLARVSEGLELVRIGEPLRPELAVWRYGAEFLRRRRFTRFVPSPEVIGAGMGLAAAGLATAAAGNALGVTAAATMGAMVGVPVGITGWLRLAKREAERPLTWILSQSVPVAITAAHAFLLDLRASTEPDGWTASLIHAHGRQDYSGAVGRRIVGAVMAHANRQGGSVEDTKRALELVETSTASDDPLRDLIRAGHVIPERSSVGLLPAHTRLAIEMSLHERLERRAFDGELAELRRAWRDAEEIAAIADDLLLPASVRQWMEKRPDRG